jgi:glycopeptide antibiotics resistance protein
MAFTSPSDDRPARSTLRVRIAGTGLALCVLVVLLATMWPTPLDRGFESSIDRLLDVLHRNGIPTWFGYNKLEFSANIGMFVPVGFLIALVLPARAWWVALILSPLLSVAIEASQAAFLTARFATPMDVLANSLGAIVGIFLAVVLRHIVYARDQKVIAQAIWEMRRGQVPTALR